MPKIGADRDADLWSRGGFAFIELLVATGVMSFLVGGLIAAINPSRRLAETRNSKRSSDVAVIAQALKRRLADNGGTLGLDCSAGPLPTSSEDISSGGYDLAPCLLPDYLISVPIDPSAPLAHFDSIADYDTGYDIFVDSSTGGAVISAASAELGETVSASVSE